jgi:hypothetical protein
MMFTKIKKYEISLFKKEPLAFFTHLTRDQQFMLYAS